MKKYFFFAAAALLALAACSKVTPVAEPDQEIGFSVVNRLSGTKADDADRLGHLEFYAGKTFNVFAFANEAEWSNANSGVNAKYMNDVTISNTGTDTAPVWKAADAYYWPKKAYLSFAAYSPSDATAPNITKTSDNASINYAWGTYTVAASNKAEYADDLMVSDFVKDLQANPATATHFTAGVPILFNHLLTKLTFKFNRAIYDNVNVDEASSYITLTKVEIVDHFNKGGYTANVWTPTTDKVTSTVNGTNTNGLKLEKPAENPTFADWGDSIIVLPQDLFTGEGESLVPGAQTLKLTYTIHTEYKTGTDTANTVVEEEGVESSASLYLSNLSSWGINKSIVYNVTINPLSKDEILFDPAIVDWVDGGTGAITVK